MEKKLRVTGNERIDIMDFIGQINLVCQEFHNNLQGLQDETMNILQGYDLAIGTGLQVQLLNDTSIGYDANGVLHERPSANPENYALAPNATNYIQMQFLYLPTDFEFRAFWDPTGSGGDGVEFQQEVFTRDTLTHVITVNQTGFTNDPSYIPLGVAITNATVVTSLDTSAKPMFHKARAFAWDAVSAGVRGASGVRNARSMYDATAQIISEMQGTAYWADVPWSNLKLLREYQNIFYTEGGNISFEGALGANTLGWDADIHIEIAGRAAPYVVSAANYPILDGQCLYVNVPIGAPSGPLPVVTATIDQVPVNPSMAGFSAGIVVLFFRRLGSIYGTMDIPELQSGETVIIGDEMSENIRSRLGLLTESTYKTYPGVGLVSNGIINQSDDYATAIGKLATLAALPLGNMRYVSVAGSDATGNGSFLSPFATVAKALSTITDASENKLYTIVLGSGLVVEAAGFAITDMNGICIVGESDGTTFWVVSDGAGGYSPVSITYTAAFAQTDAFIELMNLSLVGSYDTYVGSGITVNTTAITNAAGFVLELNNAVVPGAVTLRGRGAGLDTLLVENSAQIIGGGTSHSFSLAIDQAGLAGNWIVDDVGFDGTHFDGAGNAAAMYIRGSINYTDAATYQISGNTKLQIWASPMAGASYSLTGAQCLMQVDAVSVPDVSLITVNSGALVRLVSSADMLGYGALHPTNYRFNPGSVSAALDAISDTHAMVRATQIEPGPSATRVKINPSDVVLTTGATASKELNNQVVSFAGAILDFQTGNIYKLDNVTLIGTFTLATIASTMFRFYSISLVGSLTGADNRLAVVVQVAIAQSDGASIATAPVANYIDGIKCGQVCVQNIAGTIQPIADANIIEVGTGSGSSSGGSGGTAESPADGFMYLVSDKLPSAAGGAGTYVDAAHTSGGYNAGKKLYQLGCDKTVAITAVGTALTLSVAPTGFALAVNCIVWVNSLSTWRRVTAVSSANQGTLDHAFPSDPTAAAGMVAQAVFTEDLTAQGDSAHHQRGIDIFTGTDITQIQLEYEDSSAVADSLFDPVVNAAVVGSAANAGVAGAAGLPTSDQFNTIFTRPDAPAVWNQYGLTVSAGNSQRCFVAFFPNPNNAAITTQANLINYRVSMYAIAALNNGGFLNTAFVMTDGSLSTPLNCLQPTVVGGKTRITLDWPYNPGINGGQADGDIEVLVEGLVVPKFFTGVIGQYWTPVDSFNFDLSADYSGQSKSVQVRRRQGTNDLSDANAAFITSLIGVSFPAGSEAVPAGFLPCDGSAVSRTTYSALFAVLSDKWGTGDGTTTFNLPDLRGRFVRGWDGTAGNDPDSATRFAIHGGVTGNHVGTYQNDAFGSHQHTFVAGDGTSSGSGTEPYLDQPNGLNTQNYPTSTVGGSETRPKNAYMNFIIKY